MVLTLVIIGDSRQVDSKQRSCGKADNFMSQKPSEDKSESLQTFRFIKNYLADVLKELSPWNNIRIMHTNIGRDILSGIVVAIIALPLALAFGVGSGLGAIAGEVRGRSWRIWVKCGGPGRWPFPMTVIR